MKKFDKILIANRGEIAQRIIRSARSLGYKTVAVYSQADMHAPYIALADEAVLIGPPPVAQSYLNAGNILAAAAAVQAQAIHPGYGFLSENADFAQACADAGIVFIGPAPEAIRLMGNKAEAKRRMIQASVPCVPGYEGADQSDAAFKAAAADIGFPIMVKAAAGGGGRGMRLVAQKEDLPAALSAARSEAKNAFGSDELILEKALQQSRHVEFQIFGDQHGNVIHLGERDCSVQRRHQKVIEEAPCPIMTSDLRDKMGAAAVQAARSINYAGAGTIEFMLDQDKNFYFLEMNTRLQVEHPVTEMTTGFDLVAWQLRIAHGEALPIAQEGFQFHGHAIEARLYAENPSKNFLPASGHVDAWQPHESKHVRVDHGLRAGLDISPFYDPMIAKIIAWGENRHAARQRLRAALQNVMIAGPPTNRDFLIQILADENFASGQATTDFLKNYAYKEPMDGAAAPIAASIAALINYRHDRHQAASQTAIFSNHLLDWTSAGHLTSRFRYQCAEKQMDILITALGDDHYRITHDDQTHHAHILAASADQLRLMMDDVLKTISYAISSSGMIHLIMDGGSFRFANLLHQAAGIEESASSGLIAAPMHGRIHSLLVQQGDEVAQGQPLAILEAMKMEHEITAPIEGRVKNVNVKQDQQITADTIIMEIAPREEKNTK